MANFEPIQQGGMLQILLFKEIYLLKVLYHRYPSHIWLMH